MHFVMSSALLVKEFSKKISSGLFIKFAGQKGADKVFVNEEFNLVLCLHENLSSGTNNNHWCKHLHHCYELQNS